MPIVQLKFNFYWNFLMFYFEEEIAHKLSIFKFVKNILLMEGLMAGKARSKLCRIKLGSWRKLLGQIVQEFRKLSRLNWNNSSNSRMIIR